MTEPEAAGFVSFSVSWDYRCPFARNVHEHVMAGLNEGAPWDVRFVAFSLDQVHVEDGQPDVWDDPTKAPALLAPQVGIAVRDRWPWAFRRTHIDLFAARHDEGNDLGDKDVLAAVLERRGVDAEQVFLEVASGRPLATFRAEHEKAVAQAHAFGVPTFIVGDQAVFVRLMNRPGEGGGGGPNDGRETIERVLGLVSGWTDLNEFKHTSIAR